MSVKLRPYNTLRYNCISFDLHTNSIDVQNLDVARIGIQGTVIILWVRALTMCQLSAMFKHEDLPYSLESHCPYYIFLWLMI